MVDTVTVCPASAPDLFLGFSGAAWTAISSFVSAASVIFLVLYNWRYLRIAREQTTAAMSQAETALKSLDTLQKQISDQRELELHSALVILQEAQSQVALWRNRFKTASPSEANPVQLLPEDWDILTVFIARRFPSLTQDIRHAGHELRDATVILNEVLHVDYRNRAGNNSMSIRTDELRSKLDNLNRDIQGLEYVLSPPK